MMCFIVKTKRDFPEDKKLFYRIFDPTSHNLQEVAQLSQRDRAAGWVSFGQKWKTLFCRQYRSIYNHCDLIGMQSLKVGEIKQNKVCNAVQGHSNSPMSLPIESPYATSY